MKTEFGVENGGTPIGDRKSLERLAAEVNERERQRYLAVKAQKEAERQRANNAQNL
jgi:hypothetical protein